MKSSISCAALLVALSAGTAQATGPIAPPPPYVPEIVPMPDPDWGGFYIGGSVGLSQGDMFDIGGPYDLADDSFTGSIFAGYRWCRVGLNCEMRNPTKSTALLCP